MVTIFIASICFLPLAATLDTHIDPTGQLLVLYVGKACIQKGETTGKIGIKVWQPLLYKLQVCKPNFSIFIVHVVLSCGIKKPKPLHIPLCIKQLTDWNFTYMKRIIRFVSKIHF